MNTRSDCGGMRSNIILFRSRDTHLQLLGYLCHLGKGSSGGYRVSRREQGLPWKLERGVKVGRRVLLRLYNEACDYPISLTSSSDRACGLCSVHERAEVHSVGLEASDSAHRCLATAISKYVFCSRDTIVFWCQ